MTGPEIWKPVRGFEGYYDVSNYGRVRSLDRIKCDGVRMKGRIMKASHDACGYEIMQLRKDGIIKHLSVHRMVAMAFIPNDKNLPQVNHIDEVRDHNTADNLEWCSVVYNQNYGNRRMRSSLSSTGECNARHILTEKDVIEIRKTYVPGHKKYGINPLAERYGVKPVTINKIVQRKLWKHI